MPSAKVGVVGIPAQIVERQDGDAFFRDRRTGRRWLDRGLFLTRKFALQLIGDLLGDCALNGLGQRRHRCGGRLRQRR